MCLWLDPMEEELCGPGICLWLDPMEEELSAQNVGEWKVRF
jgi:hypothetical protein